MCLSLVRTHVASHRPAGGAMLISSNPSLAFLSHPPYRVRATCANHFRLFTDAERAHAMSEVWVLGLSLACSWLVGHLLM